MLQRPKVGKYDHCGNLISTVELVRVAPADSEVFIDGYLIGFLANGRHVMGDSDRFDIMAPGWRTVFDSNEYKEVLR